MNRDEIRDALADWVGGRLVGQQADVVDRAVAEDEDLRREADLLRVIAARRESVPASLEADIIAAVARDRAATSVRPAASARAIRWRVPAWAVGAAALLAAALGTLTLMERTDSVVSVEDSDALVAVLEGGYSPWVTDDGTVAGAPILDGLSEEELESLLEEMGG
jgi:hypothetical protein